MVEGARLESVYTSKGYQGFESLFLRNPDRKNECCRSAACLNGRSRNELARLKAFGNSDKKMRSISRFASRGLQGARREAGDNGAQRRNPDEAERINKLQGGAVNPARVNREVRDNGMK